MALSLGVRTGQEIEVGESLVTIKDIKPPNLIILSVDSGEDVVVSDQDRKEILPGVYVFTGAAKEGNGNRLAFEAPRSIGITRRE